mmetsp:Transcript_23726/g.68609  ORF Transcript_23726/g.68609 Transcript_23726/m.68609 type:complete len:269 (-) Transcript_23726:88-894(-)
MGTTMGSGSTGVSKPSSSSGLKKPRAYALPAMGPLFASRASASVAADLAQEPCRRRALAASPASTAWMAGRCAEGAAAASPWRCGRTLKMRCICGAVWALAAGWPAPTAAATAWRGRRGAKTRCMRGAPSALAEDRSALDAAAFDGACAAAADADAEDAAMWSGDGCCGGCWVCCTAGGASEAGSARTCRNTEERRCRWERRAWKVRFSRAEWAAGGGGGSEAGGSRKSEAAAALKKLAAPRSFFAKLVTSGASTAKDTAARCVNKTT